MKKIYTPWRSNYVSKKYSAKKALKNDCVFCDQFAQNDDEKYLIIKRFRYSAIIMNYYPYNAGHLMVIPYEHVSRLQDLTPDARAELMEGANEALLAIQEKLKCEGFNIGINLGAAGGGGIKEHLHVHVLPRWLGDTNFLATLAETKLVCSSFQDIYKEIKEVFDRGN